MAECRYPASYYTWVTKKNCLLPHGKLNILIDGQFGSTGKGLVASYVGSFNYLDMAVSNASMNAGHTFYIDGKKYITKHLPVSGIINKYCKIYLCSGAIINPKFLLEEINRFNIADRIYIHPRTAVIEHKDIEYEKQGSIKKIASTCSGVGSALMRKIGRSAKLAKDIPQLKPFIKEIDLNDYLNEGNLVLMEVPQGFDLSINSGFSYPHCTSREITIPAALADAQVHPSLMGEVIAVIRTFPIRVGHIIKDDEIIGDSGPFYPDSKEITWEDIGVKPEYTTNTDRIRRVATFSNIQYKKMIKALKPDYLFLNFINYLSYDDLKEMLYNIPEVSHVCNGPETTNIYLKEDYI